MTTLLRSTLSLGVAGAATLLIIAGSAAPVRAGAAPVGAAAAAVRISTRGIDLAHPAGVSRITHAIATTARRICSTNDSLLAAQRDAAKCTRAAIADAMPQLAQKVDAARDARAMLAEASLPGAPARR